MEGVSNPLLLATANGQVEEVRKLLPSCDVNVKGANGITPVHVAAFMGHSQVLQLLIQRRANPNPLTPGDSPLWTALRKRGSESPGHDTCAAMLVASGARLTRADTTALHRAACVDSPLTIRAIVAQGFSPDTLDSHGVSALETACQQHNLRALGALIESGANVGAQSDEGGTALHIAAASRSVQCIHMLLAAAADPNVQDCDGLTALHVASQQGGDIEIAEALLSSPRCDPNIQDARGESSVHVAVLEGNFSLAKCLVDRGANPHIPDARHKTALDYAAQQPASGQPVPAPRLAESAAPRPDARPSPMPESAYSPSAYAPGGQGGSSPPGGWLQEAKQEAAATWQAVDALERERRAKAEAEQEHMNALAEARAQAFEERKALEMKYKGSDLARRAPEAGLESGLSPKERVLQRKQRQQEKHEALLAQARDEAFEERQQLEAKYKGKEGAPKRASRNKPVVRPEEPEPPWKRPPRPGPEEFSPEPVRRPRESQEMSPEPGRRPRESQEMSPEQGRRPRESQEMSPELGRRPRERQEMSPELGRRPRESQEMSPELGRRPRERQEMSPEPVARAPEPVARAPLPPPALPRLPEGWSSNLEPDSGMTYYSNIDGRTQWHHPSLHLPPEPAPEPAHRWVEQAVPAPAPEPAAEWTPEPVQQSQISIEQPPEPEHSLEPTRQQLMLAEQCRRADETRQLAESRLQQSRWRSSIVFGDDSPGQMESPGRSVGYRPGSAMDRKMRKKAMYG